MTPAEVGAETHLSATPPPAEDVAAALAAVLASSQFRNSLQCSSFLKYVVKHSLSGEDHLLRERVIGHEVFRRAPDYETGEDPVVRIRAAEVRKRLAQFYHASHADLQIDIPPGSYRVLFHLRESTPEARPPVPPTSPGATVPAPEAAAPMAAAPVPTAAEARATSPADAVAAHGADLPPFLPATTASAARLPKQRLAIGVVLSALALGAAYVATGHGNRGERLERQFWAPWVQPGRPVLIAMGSNAVYRLRESVAGQYASHQAAPATGWEVFPPAQDLAALHGDDFTPAENSFVALGDVTALADLATVLARNNQHFEERFPNDISFAELRGSPAILIGGYNNPTSLELTRSLRFRLTGHNEIDDAQTGRKWLLHASLDSHDTEDYAILTRTLQQGTDAPMLSVAGMGQYGTQSAAEFVTTPALLTELDQVLGANWQGRNFQLVLHVKIHDFKPGRAEIIAHHTW